jgi:hypothetical protein
VLEKYPDAQLVFMDTLFEDEDNYRFMGEFEKRFGVKILRLVEGRNPYQVSRDGHVIPNNTLAPCTFRLKIDLFRKWLAMIEGETTIYIGYDFSEVHRCESTSRNYEALGYKVEYPLLWKPIETRSYSEVARNDWQIEPPRIYPCKLWRQVRETRTRRLDTNIDKLSRSLYCHRAMGARDARKRNKC